MRRRHAWMTEPRNRVLADAEVPRRMPGPFDFELVAVPERQLDLLSLELVGDDAVVDPANLNQPPVTPIVETPAFALHFIGVDRAHAAHLFGGNEIRPR